MHYSKANMLKGIWRQMWIAGGLLYCSYFLYRWVGVFVAGIIGKASDILLYKESILLNSHIFWELGLSFVFMLVIMPVIDLITNILIFRGGLRYERNVIDCVFQKQYETIMQWKASEWLGRISKDSLQYRQMAVITPTRIVADATVFTVAVIAMLRIDVVLTIISIAGLLLSAVLQFVFRKKSNLLLEENRNYQNTKKSLQVEMVRGHAFWKSYTCVTTIPVKMHELFLNFWKQTKQKDITLTAILDTIQKAILSGTFSFSLFYGVQQVMRGSMTAGNFVEIYFLVIQLKTIVGSILSNLQVMRGYNAQVQRMQVLLFEEDKTGVSPIETWTKLHFHNVTYRYPNTQEGMFTKSFSIKRGEQINLEGQNGSGKTTLINILCGLFTSINSEIKLDYIPFSEYDLDVWRERIGYIQQFPDVFPGSVRENIRIGNLAATKDEVDAVMSKVGLSHLFDRKLNGTKNELSGGEIKRIELARVLLRIAHCELLLLDEPFENLDAEGKTLVEEIINTEGIAKVIVSHDSTNASI